MTREIGIKHLLIVLVGILATGFPSTAVHAIQIKHNNSTIVFAEDFEGGTVGGVWNNGSQPGNWALTGSPTVVNNAVPGAAEGSNYGRIERLPTGSPNEMYSRAQFNPISSGKVDLDLMTFIPDGKQWLSVALGENLGIVPATPNPTVHAYVTFHLNSTHKMEDGAIAGFPDMGFQYKNNEWMRLHIGYDYDNPTSGYTVDFTTSAGTFNYTRGLTPFSEDFSINSMLIRFEDRDNLAYLDAVPSNTGPTQHTINLAQSGMTLNHKVFGQAVPTSGGSEEFEQEMNDTTVAITGKASIRGVAGGLSADTYNWKDRTGRVVGEFGVPGRPTLEYLRYARDQQAELFVTVNARGTGSGVSSQDFVWQDNSLAPLTTLAADWVRYANKIVPQYRQGDTLPAADAAIVNGLGWGDYDRLLDPQEAATSKVTYWEIGNEPDVGITDSNGVAKSLTPSQYADRYVAITTAMFAQDPTIKVGPVVKRGVNDAGNAPDPWLLAVLARSDAQVDFISYHPYQNIFDPYYSSGQLPTTQILEERLRGVKQKQRDEYGLVKSAIQTNNATPGRPQRNINTPAVASEWNVGSASSNGTFGARSMAHALGAAETMFTLAENANLLAAHYWVWPVGYWEGTPTPTYRLYEALEQYGGDKLVETYSDDENFRLYTTTEESKKQIALWGLNFSDSENKVMQLSLTNPQWQLANATIKLMRLIHVDGTDIGLLDSTSPNPDDPASINWVVTDLTGQIDLSNFQLTFDDATITLLLVTNLMQTLPGDYNRDGSVDTADYIVWRNTFNQNVEQGTGADGNNNGHIDDDDYGIWRSHFGTTGSNQLMTVPEAASSFLLKIGLLASIFRRRMLCQNKAYLGRRRIDLAK